MPMNWNAETNAKLFMGVLTQIRNVKFKLDFNELAAYMGDDCTVRAVEQQVTKLRKMVEASSTPGLESTADATPDVTPNASPEKKRKRGRPPKNPVADTKIVNVVVEVARDSNDMVEEKVSKEEMKDGVKEECGDDIWTL